jgi:chaperone modulatory protein CbpM
MPREILKGTLLDERIHVSLTDICQACSTRTDWVIELVEEGILEPVGNDPEAWHFPGHSISRAHIARRLQLDLGINLAGVALALDLLAEVAALRARQT